MVQYLADAVSVGNKTIVFLISFCTFSAVIFFYRLLIYRSTVILLLHWFYISTPLFYVLLHAKCSIIAFEMRALNWVSTAHTVLNNAKCCEQLYLGIPELSVTWVNCTFFFQSFIISIVFGYELQKPSL